MPDTELCKLLNSQAVPLIEECFLSCNDNSANFSVTHGGHLGQECRCLYVEVQPECLHFTYNVVQCGWLTWRTFSTIKHTSKVSNSISCQICSAFCMCIRYFHSICVHQCQKSDYLDMTHENTLLLTIGSTFNFRIPSTYCKTLKIIPGYCTVTFSPSLVHLCKDQGIAARGRTLLEQDYYTPPPIRIGHVPGAEDLHGKTSRWTEIQDKEWNSIVVY